MHAKITNCFIVAAMLGGMMFFITEQADARGGLGKLILSPIMKSIGKTKTKTHVKNADSTPVMSKQQLRDCLNQKNDIETELKNLESYTISINMYDKEIESLSDEIRQKENVLNSLGTHIDNEEPLVDVQNQQSVDSYNLLVNEYQSMQQIYNTMVRHHNVIIKKRNAKASEHKKIIRTYNSNIDKFEEKCAYSYRQSDMDEILAEKKSK